MKELLIKLRDHLINQESIINGLCWEINFVDSFSEDDKEAVRLYIYNHRPRRGKHYIPQRWNRPHYWPCGEIQPRINWLNDQIKRFK